MTPRVLVVVLIGMVVAASARAGEPPTGTQSAIAAASESCDAKLTRSRQGWADAEHTDIANDFHKERIEIPDKWCRMWETTGAAREFAAGDFGRVLFTGPGIHPSVAGSLVPGSGFAVGGSFSTEQHPARLRVVELISAMASANGSSSIAARLFAIGASVDPTDVLAAGKPRRTGTLTIARQTLAELTHFGEGNDSEQANQSTFSLRRTLAGGAFEVPVGHGLFLSAQAAALSIDPGDFSGAAFLPSAVGSSRAASRYAVYGGGARLAYPTLFKTRGYATQVGAVFREYQGLADRSSSFGRADLGWTNAYTAAPAVGTFRIGALATLAVVPEGHAVPVALQPTVGGTDLDGSQVLRSFADYRFRAPNRFAASVEYEHEVIGPLSSLAFVDWGGVATRTSDFDFRHFHRSVGVGVSLHLGAVTVLKAFYAFGGGEGTRTTFTGASDSFAEPFLRQTLF